MTNPAPSRAPLAPAPVLPPGAAATADARVTVVIACYRHAHLLPAAVQSVRAQRGVRVECVVVDDGSPDDVPAALAAIEGAGGVAPGAGAAGAAAAGAAPPWRLVRQPNRGLAAARNAGLRVTRTELVAFLDADDVLTPDGIALGVAALEAAPAASFAAGAYLDVPLGGTPVLRRPAAGEPAYRAMLRGNFIGMHGAVLYRRAALEAVGGFRADLRACEDYDVYLRLLRHGSVALHAGVVAEYRHRAGGLSKRPTLMLATGLAALHAQAAHARRDPADWAAYGDGVERLRGWYAEPAVATVGERLRGGPAAWPRAAAMLARLAAADPGFVGGRVRRALVRRVLRGPRPHGGE